ncbi:MAG: hypothetical protein GXY85_04490 [Candidatus Brocadiaceae bacterium]|mgnify:FL=1|nr:hypothetical protein [Candidatus Brocadiaceae bacterium]
MDRQMPSLLQRVTRRLHVCRAARRFHVLTLVLAGAYAVLLLISRLLGLIPDAFEPVTLVAVVAGALALALAGCRRPGRAEAARRVDEHQATDDLFLTSVLIDTSAGSYAPLVLRDAEQAAGGCSARDVVPWAWGRQARNAALALAVLLAGVLFLPQLDPFGRGEERERRAGQRRELQESRKATAMRAAQLTPLGDAELSEEVRKAIDELKQTFDGMKPDQKDANLRRLAAREADLAKLWRTAGEDRLRSAPRAAGPLQRFGARRNPASEVWHQELQQGVTKSVREELSELKRMAQKLAETDDEAERQTRSRELRQRLEQMKDFAANQCASAPLDAALQRALSQLAAAGLEGLSSEALAGLQESLDLSELELEALAESLRDLQALQEALKTLQYAKRLGELNLLDGEACAACMSIEDYEDLYERLMGGCCTSCGGPLDGHGVCANCRGIGGKEAGTVAGGPSPGSTPLDTEYQPEKARASVRAGKMLLSIKAQGFSLTGQAAADYRQSAEEVRQGLNEAILHEQIPPAYHEAIRKYFDSLGGADGQAEECE